MRILLLASFTAFVIAGLMPRFAPVVSVFAFAVGVVLAWRYLRQVPGSERYELMRSMRLPLALALASAMILAAMELGPRMSERIRRDAGLLWVTLAYACLAVLLVQIVATTMSALRERRKT